MKLPINSKTNGPVKAEDFCFWLLGVAETLSSPPTAEQWDLIQVRLNLVMYKEQGLVKLPSPSPYYPSILPNMGKGGEAYGSNKGVNLDSSLEVTLDNYPTAIQNLYQDLVSRPQEVLK